MNMHTKRIAASALVALLALSLSPTPIEPASAQFHEDGLARCYMETTIHEKLNDVMEEYGLIGAGVPPFANPCKEFNDLNQDVGAVWVGLQLDENRDGIGDLWQEEYEALHDTIAPYEDIDDDGLDNIEEFWWLTNPLLPDTDLDAWNDGPEAEYWSQFGGAGAATGGTLEIGGQQYAYSAPLAVLDTDGDGVHNMWDKDSDEDGLIDGEEQPAGARPELQDSDGDGLIDGGITPLLSERVIGEVHDVGSLPGLADSDGDGVRDREEYEHWTQVRGYSSTMSLDTDGDGFINILDADSDGDGALDGQEVQFNTRADRPDTDGDKLPDGWEIQYNQAATVSSATQDNDRDGATAEAEYCYGITLTACRSWNYAAEQDYYHGGTIPNDADTDDDHLLDGDEFTAGTNPHWWDTDADGMPDEFELQYGLTPLDAADAGLDADGDAFDQDLDGTPEQVHSNLQEYQYGRPLGHDESAQGPWQFGTIPTDVDTDDDGANDAQEVYYGTNARIPADLAIDDDQDGLNWTMETVYGTDPNDPDTDGDGLCDGGRAPACTYPGLSGTNHPGEQDYASTPWNTDSDGDGIMDGVEATLWDPRATGQDQDLDGDFLGGIIDADNDGDGLRDGIEESHGASMDRPDTDGDGINDGDEVHVYGTRADDEDTDADGLLDGAEIQLHRTDPLQEDTDSDDLTDGAEVSTHGTDPLLWDTDGDAMPDAWEVTEGTQPRTPDAGLDPDADGLSNGYEHQVSSHPLDADSDDDGLPDGWEDRHETGITTASASSDPDGDQATNLQEFEAGTQPRNPDTDADGLIDGDELAENTDPLATDSDLDGLLDGDEVHVHGTNPLSRDSDDDRLDDFDEVQAGTDPWDADSDDDDLSDYEEVFVHQGKYDPNDPDTNGDGFTDGQNAALERCPTCDDDNDGLSNEQEVIDYDTNPFNADTDCDGVEDGPEVSYWNGQQYSLSTFKPYLRNSDVDGDGIKDGVEIGPTGTGSHVLYRTMPDAADTDADSLGDGSEARNNFRPDCAQASASASWGPMDGGVESLLRALPGTEGHPIVGHSGSPLPEPVPGEDLASAATDADLLARLVPGALYEDPSGLLYGVDGNGIYIQGGYGVRLYPDLTALLVGPDGASPDLSDLLGPQQTSHESGVPCTNPLLPDTDRDGLTDSEEQSGSRNPYKGQRHDSGRAGGNTDPCAQDTDDDGIRDGPEIGARRNGGALSNAWVTNPNRQDTDQDGKPDNVEDANQNGVNDDLSYAPSTGVYTARQGSAGASSPVDADTDDDGLPDGVIGTLSDPAPLNWDLDGDGLSDGLESGVTKPLVVDGIQYTLEGKNVFGLWNWPTFQAFEGDYVAGVPLTTPVDDPDKDDDGLLDGLEDWNHNGNWQDNALYGSVTLKEMNPDSSDSDGDGLGDGRELLVFIRSQTQRPTVSFGELFTSKGFSVSQLVYDASNVWETDPRKLDTDGDGVKDGFDMNPRLTSNFVALTLDGFEFLDVDVDRGSPSAREEVELFVSPLTVELPFMSSEYRIEMNPSASIPVKIKDCNLAWGGIECSRTYGYRELPDVLFEKLENEDYQAGVPSVNSFGVDFTGVIWKIERLGSEPVIKFQLPEGIDNVNPTDMKVTIKATLQDEDARNHDTLDINADPDQSKRYGEITVDLLADTAGTYKESFGLEYFHSEQFEKTMVGNRVTSRDSNDAKLGVEVGDTIATHFANALKITKIGGVAHLTEAAGAGGKDYLGNQGDIGP